MIKILAMNSGSGSLSNDRKYIETSGQLSSGPLALDHPDQRESQSPSPSASADDGVVRVAADSEDCCSSVLELCRLQLAELDLMAAMFPGAGELCVIDQSAVAERHSVCEAVARAASPAIPAPTADTTTSSSSNSSICSPLVFTIKLETDQSRIELYVRLPARYPDERPHVMVRGDFASGAGSQNINKHLSDYLETLDSQQLCMASVVGWLQEHCHLYVAQADTSAQIHSPSREEAAKAAAGGGGGGVDSTEALRLWLVSHHIYSRIKRRHMLALAKEHAIRGVCLPGKPGIVCVEGAAVAVNSWWKQVKSWTWKRITVRKEESFCFGAFVFGAYSELDLCGADRLAQFANYLAERGCTTSLSEILGLRPLA